MPRKRLNPDSDYAPQIAVRMNWDVIERLDWYVAQSGIRKTRSDLVREAVDHYLAYLDAGNPPFNCLIYDPKRTNRNSPIPKP
jgi:hypothetical protein